MPWTLLPTPAEEWDQYADYEADVASLEHAAGPALDPTDPEGAVHGWLEDAIATPAGEYDDGAMEREAWRQAVHAADLALHLEDQAMGEPWDLAA